MRLHRLKADGFGLLRGEYRFDRDRVALVIDENERGKTSLLHAIVAGLYGLDGDARRYRGVITPLDRWRPWDGGPYRIELDIEARGERYTILRDFGAGTAAVWNGRGQNVTAEFASDRDEVSVGRVLLGLEAEEFAKCSFWRQGELADVVPDQEKDRRQSTLQARLEQAADTVSGDTSAIEAIQALDRSLRSYSSLLPEAGVGITVDNVIKRLEGARDKAAIDRAALEADYRGLAGPLEQIAKRGIEESALRAEAARLDTWRRRLRAEDARRRLERDERLRQELDQLEAEARELAGVPPVPVEAEASLSADAARHDERKRQIEQLAGRRRSLEEARARADAALTELGEITGTSGDAESLAAQAIELRRILEEESRARGELDVALETMRAQGSSPERALAVLPRFEELEPAQRALLSEQGRLALAVQAEMAVAEQSRTAAGSRLRDLARWKRPRFATGIVLAVLGAAAAGVALALPKLLSDLTLLPLAITIAGASVSGIGLLMLVATALARRSVREAARRRIDDADEQLRQAHQRATENETRIELLAASLQYPNAAAMLDDWGEAQRLRDLHAPVVQAEQRLTLLERRRAAVVSEVMEPLERAGGRIDPDAPTAEPLADAAARVRRRLELVQQRGVADERLERLEDEIRALEREASELERRAGDTIASAGLRYAPGTPWSTWIGQVGDVARRSTRRAELIRERDARARERLDDVTVEVLRAEITHAAAATVLSESDLEEVKAYRAPAEAETRLAEVRTRLEELTGERERLDRTIQSVSDRYHAEHPGLTARVELVEAELARAIRFRDAVRLARATIERVARETHRRWAEFLDERVTELLAGVGSSITRVRFGDDLDFAVTLGDVPTTRGKALHQLSTGARDQLHLAVRLAISEFLSRGGEALPLLIDDCFATSDDERTRAAMRMLLDGFSRAHQVILVTCHRQRYQALAELDASFYREHAQWLELRPVFTGTY